ncbi:MAG: hypothetical protein M3506_00395 [Chloroflexota bacterium]|nr:hypothetical protein [Chloroflexota bacterium]
MSQEYTDGGDQATPRGWEALRRTHDTARLWRDYSAEINQENRELTEALNGLIWSVRNAPGVRGPQGAEFRQVIGDALYRAAFAVGRANKRRLGYDEGGK